MNGAWNRFVELDVSLDRRVLGAFRILYGWVLLYDLGRRAQVLTLFYSNEGVLSNHYVLYRPQDAFQLSLLNAFSTPGEVRVAFAQIGLVYALYTLGLCTRLMQILALVCLTSLNSRNLFVKDSGVATLIVLGVWTLFLPLGERLSLDALRAEAYYARVGERIAVRNRASMPFRSRCSRSACSCSPSTGSTRRKRPAPRGTTGKRCTTCSGNGVWSRTSVSGSHSTSRAGFRRSRPTARWPSSGVCRCSPFTRSAVRYRWPRSCWRWCCTGASRW